MRRRTLFRHAAALAPAVLAPWAARAEGGLSRAPLRFPADHAAHPDTRIEWWYVTGWLSLGGSSGAGSAASAATGGSPAPRPDFGFQLTFFRSRTGLAADSPSRFAARQLVFAHAALTDLGHDGAPARLLHDQRLAREGFGLAVTPRPDGRPMAVSLQDWSLALGDAPRSLQVRGEAFALALSLRPTQPLLLQGDAGWSRKGPRPEQASRYYSEPQLAVAGTVARAGRDATPRAVQGRAWLDHEWSDELMSPDAVGWDWVGVNLLDGGALTLFQLRREDGSVVWGGGSWRARPEDAPRAFQPGELRMTPGRAWHSAATGATYPVEWTLDTPAGRFTLHALLDDQEMDSRRSTGSVYWEGLAELRDAGGRRAGLGYLEMTGRAGRLRI